MTNLPPMDPGAQSPQVDRIPTTVITIGGAVQPGPTPVTWIVERTPDGRWIAVTLRTVTGTHVLFLDPDSTHQFAQALTGAAGAVPGLTIPQLDLGRLNLGGGSP